MQRHRGKASVLLVLALGLDVARAGADEAAPVSTPVPTMTATTRPTRTTTVTRRYAIWTLAADGAALALIGGGALVGGDPGITLVGLGLGGAALGAPVVHVTRGHVGQGFKSAALRQGMFWGGVLIGALVAGGACDEDNGSDVSICTDALGGAVIGGAVGYAGAVAIDAGLLAVERRPTTSGLAIVPRLSVTTERVHLGLAGQF
jgi:hypothetical protein